MADGDNRELFDRMRNVETIVTRIDARESIMYPKVEDHEKRLQSLELKDAKRGGFVTAITGAASVIGGAISALMSWLISHYSSFVGN